MLYIVKYVGTCNAADSWGSIQGQCSGLHWRCSCYRKQWWTYQGLYQCLQQLFFCSRGLLPLPRLLRMAIYSWSFKSLPGQLNQGFQHICWHFKFLETLVFWKHSSMRDSSGKTKFLWDKHNCPCSCLRNNYKTLLM